MLMDGSGVAGLFAILIKSQAPIGSARISNAMPVCFTLRCPAAVAARNRDAA